MNLCNRYVEQALLKIHVMKQYWIMDIKHSALLITVLDTSDLSSLWSGHRTPIQIRQEVTWAPISLWSQWSGLWSGHRTPIQIRQVTWAPASTWTQWSGLWSCHRTPVQIRQEVRWAPALPWTQWSGLWSGHSTQYQSHGKAVGTSINTNTVVKFMGWSQNPLINHMGS